MKVFYLAGSEKKPVRITSIEKKALYGEPAPTQSLGGGTAPAPSPTRNNFEKWFHSQHCSSVDAPCGWDATVRTDWENGRAPGR